jgi:predicted nucleotidyltransferase
MEDEKHEIILVGSSLRGLLKESDIEHEYARITLKRRMEDGIRLKFLLTHPVIADLRARQENRRADMNFWRPTPATDGKSALRACRTVSFQARWATC